MVAAKLQHPGIFLGGLSENGDVVEIFAEDRVVAFLSLKELVAFHDLLNLLKTPWAERGRNQSESGRTLRGIQFLEADASARNERSWQVGPVGSLLRVIKCEQHALPLLRIEGRKESICGAHDSCGCCLRRDVRQRRADQGQSKEAADHSKRKNSHLLFSFSSRAPNLLPTVPAAALRSPSSGRSS